MADAKCPRMIHNDREIHPLADRAIGVPIDIEIRELSGSGLEAGCRPDACGVRRPSFSA